MDGKDENRPPEDSLAEPPQENSGEFLFRVLKPFGCFVVLGAMVLVLLICFTYQRDPVTNYEAPQGSVYYAAHPDELAVELERNLLPYLPECTLTVGDSAVTITASADDLPDLQRALTAVYDESLFRFQSE
ncbi:MAG: hypothetical protein LIO54_06975 [Oscillospiraceae bacterium]|nr:hypothetical protein [Oscillospiraceae bacterium]